jgi:choice-of-anchor C domain-containing protein
MRAIIACLAVVLLLGSIIAAADDEKKKETDKQTNLLVNGSFEEGPEASEMGFKPLDEGSQDIKGWIVTRGQIDYIDGYWEAADGKRSIDLHGSPGYGGIKQTFKTKKGQKYRVTFSLAGNPDGTVAEKKMAVKAAGKQEEFTFNVSGKSRTDMGWATQVWDFKAIDSETTLELFTVMTEDENFGPALDNVSVTEAKE